MILVGFVANLFPLIWVSTDVPYEEACPYESPSSGDICMTAMLSCTYQDADTIILAYCDGSMWMVATTLCDPHLCPDDDSIRIFDFFFRNGFPSCWDMPCSPNGESGLLCSDGTFGAYGDWEACGGYENREACPVEGATKPITCRNGSCEADILSCYTQGGVRYGADVCPSNNMNFIFSHA